MSEEDAKSTEIRIGFMDSNGLSKLLLNSGFTDYTINITGKTVELKTFDMTPESLEVFAKKVQQLIENSGGKLDETTKISERIRSGCLTQDYRKSLYRRWNDSTSFRLQQRRGDSSNNDLEKSIKKALQTLDAARYNEVVPGPTIEEGTVSRLKVFRMVLRLR